MFDQVRSGWVVLGSGLVRWHWIRSVCVGLGQFVSNRVRSDKVRSGQIGSGRIGSGQNGSDPIESCRIRLGCFWVKSVRLFQIEFYSVIFLAQEIAVHTFKVCPIENNTNLNSIFCLIKSSKILFFYLHFT